MCICQFACWHSKERKRAAGSETHTNDGNEFSRINHERSAMSPGDDCSGKAFVTLRFRGIVNPKFVLVKIDSQINRATRGNPLFGMRRCITQQPKTFDASVEWPNRRSGNKLHRNNRIFEESS